MRGRKKKPTNLKLLDGTYRKDRENEDEPIPETTIPSPPPGLSKRAKEEWERASVELEVLGLISEVSMAGLAVYCEAYATFIEVTEILNKIEEDGTALDKYLTITSNANVIQNPLIGIKNHASKIMREFMVEFGMTPSSAGRVLVSKKKKKKDENPFSQLG